MKIIESFQKTSWQLLFASVSLILIAGCASSPSQKSASNHIFYPPPPDAPRLQFLTSFSGEKDLGGGAGKFSTFVTGAAPPQRFIVKPYGVAISRGQLYVCDPGQGTVDILDLSRKTFTFLEAKNGAQIRVPINITIDVDGTRYLADSGANQVILFGPNGEFRGGIGLKVEPGAADSNVATPGSSSPEKGLKPTDVALTDERIYVTDLNNNCVRVYRKADRELLFKIPVDPRDEQSKLLAPTNLAMDSKNHLFVSDLAGFCVKEFDADGKYVRTYGKMGDRPGEFARPKGVAVDRQGRVYVVDAAAQVIQIFDAEGRLLLFFGEPKGSAVPLDMPAKVMIDYDHTGLFQQYAAPDFQLEYLVFATSQLGERKVSVYGFGHKK